MSRKKNLVVRMLDIRIEAGHYLVNGYTIMNGGPRFWQIRELDDLLDDEPTLRRAIKRAQSLTEGKDVRSEASI